MQLHAGTPSAKEKRQSQSFLIDCFLSMSHHAENKAPYSVLAATLGDDKTGYIRGM